jgi:hypothetical protein
MLSIVFCVRKGPTIPSVDIVEYSVCKNCFYGNRTGPIVCFHHNAKKRVFLKWNDENKRHETTNKSIRPFPNEIPPNVQYIAMCDPRRGSCKNEWCTFAHGRAEQKAWSGILRDQRLQQTGKHVLACRAIHFI